MIRLRIKNRDALASLGIPRRLSQHGKGVRVAPLVGEHCAATDCEKGVITPSSMLAVVRFSIGYVLYRKAGPMFETAFKFPNGKHHMYAHALCALDHKVPIDRLSMEMCMSRHGSCNQSQFFCEVEPKEACILIEQGAFTSNRRGVATFTPENGGAVHWICGRKDWDKELSLFKNR